MAGTVTAGTRRDGSEPARREMSRADHFVVSHTQRREGPCAGLCFSKGFHSMRVPTGVSRNVASKGQDPLKLLHSVQFLREGRRPKQAAVSSALHSAPT